MTIFSAQLKRIACTFTAITLTMLISACGSGGSGGGNNQVTQFGISDTSNLVNVEGVNGWVCLLSTSGLFGGYSYYADSTGRFQRLTANGDGSFSIDGYFPFTYTVTGESTLQILYEFQDGTSLEENLTNIIFIDRREFNATSDLQGDMRCTRRTVTTS